MADKSRAGQLFEEAEKKRIEIAKILFSPQAWVLPTIHGIKLMKAVAELVALIAQEQEAYRLENKGAEREIDTNWCTTSENERHD